MSNLCTTAHPLSPIVLSLLAAASLAGCHGKATDDAAPTAVVALPVHAYAGPDDGRSMSYPIEAAPRYANAMSFRVPGKIIERTARLGDTVHRGSVLARLDAADAEQQAAAARAGLEAADHRLTYARQTLDRDTAQFAKALIAQSTLEQTEDAHRAALAAREQAEAQWLVARNALRYHALVAGHERKRRYRSVRVRRRTGIRTGVGRRCRRPPRCRGPRPRQNRHRPVGRHHVFGASGTPFRSPGPGGGAGCGPAEPHVPSKIVPHAGPEHG